LKNFDLEVYNALRELEIAPNLRGYEMLKSAMSIIHQDKMAIYSMNKLYEAVAKEHNSTATKVERNIRHALQSANSDFLTQKKVLGTARELSSSEFMATLAEVIKIKLATVVIYGGNGKTIEVTQ